MVKIRKRTNTKRFGPLNVSGICACPGVYVILDRNHEPQYVGHSKNLARRLDDHLTQEDIPDARHFRTYRTQSTREAQTLERQLVRKLKPRHNVQEP